ncbi:MAG: acetyl-CoA decarbonylase/synthase complex subunit gamma [Planctomycetota bacterium]|nr:acetyl-CoA decarbonylase/synthase complex subunit gamma [Planctomycetota bacterium]
MALTGLDIYKLLPKTNCAKCGMPTCLAFAMALAQKKTSLDKCPDVSAQAKEALEGASAPPQRLITIGAGEGKLEVGNETVMFRHDQTFWHPCGVGIEIADTMSDAEMAARIENINKLTFDRVAQIIRVEIIAVVCKSGSPEKFAKAVKTVFDKSQKALVLVSLDPKVMEAGLKVAAARKPLVYAANAANHAEMVKLAKAGACPLAVLGKGLDEVADLTAKVKALGVEDLVIDSGAHDPKGALADATHARRLAIRKTFRPLGYPTITFTDTDDAAWEVAVAASAILKYQGMVILRGSEPWEILPLLTTRQNIYTDPRKPIQVESKIYEIGAVTKNSPVLVTTNFSLTYFTVEPEVESSKVPSYIAVVDTEGMSVLTAFAADKLTSEKVAKMLKTSGIAERVGHKKVVIPGYVSVMSGKLQEDSGWEVLVGPREASAIPSYLKTVWK